MSTPTTLRLTGLHTRYQFTETIRVPIAVIGTTLFPSLSLLFFVVPQSFAQNPGLATAATAQLAVFAVMSVCLFTYGVGVAEDRSLPWDGYTRTLPAGPAPRLIGRLLNGLAFVVIGLVPLVLIARLLTAATLPPSRLALTAAALLAAGVPLFGLGISIGYSLSTKAALAVAQSLLTGLWRWPVPASGDVPWLAQLDIDVAAHPRRPRPSGHRHHGRRPAGHHHPRPGWMDPAHRFAGCVGLPTRRGTPLPVRSMRAHVPVRDQ